MHASQVSTERWPKPRQPGGQADSALFSHLAFESGPTAPSLRCQDHGVSIAFQIPPLKRFAKFLGRPKDLEDDAEARRDVEEERTVLSFSG